MKIVIFAGGQGTRLWPLSRKKTPKQFDPMFRGKSTLQLAIERVLPIARPDDIYISTLDQYASIIRRQVPKIPDENIITEPALRDVAPAIGLAMLKLRDVGDKPVAILWADHLMKRPGNFRKGLKAGANLIEEDSERFIFFGEKARYAEPNLGWINIGSKLDKVAGIDTHKFKGWHYRPPLAKCKRMFVSGKWVWNPGYWVTTPNYVLAQFADKKPAMYRQLMKIGDALGSSREGRVLKQIYPKLEKIHFDNAILEKMKPSQAVVLMLNMGWSDPGTLYAIKEALSKSKNANVRRGQVVDFKTKDTLIFNDDPKKVVVTVGLEGMIVVATKDATLVVHKDNVPEVKKLVKSLEGTKFEDIL